MSAPAQARVPTPLDPATTRDPVCTCHHVPTPAQQRAARKAIDAVLCPRCYTPRYPRAQACSCPTELPR